MTAAVAAAVAAVSGMSRHVKAGPPPADKRTAERRGVRGVHQERSGGSAWRRGWRGGRKAQAAGRAAFTGRRIRKQADAEANVNHLVGVGPHWDAKGSRQPKVRQLQLALAVDQQVLLPCAGGDGGNGEKGGCSAAAFGQGTGQVWGEKTPQESGALLMPSNPIRPWPCCRLRPVAACAWPHLGIFIYVTCFLLSMSPGA